MYHVRPRAWKGCHGDVEEDPSGSWDQGNEIMKHQSLPEQEARFADNGLGNKATVAHGEQARLWREPGGPGSHPGSGSTGGKVVKTCCGRLDWIAGPGTQ